MLLIDKRTIDWSRPVSKESQMGYITDMDGNCQNTAKGDNPELEVIP